MVVEDEVLIIKCIQGISLPSDFLSEQTGNDSSAWQDASLSL